MNTLEVDDIDISELNHAVQLSINTAENQTETGELKENIVLDLSNQLKEKFDKLHDLEFKLIKRKKKETKLLLKMYGMIKSIEKLTDQSIEVPHELQTLIDLLTEMMDDFIDDEFFPKLYRLDD
tara:strand:+ start:1699 stop:2070 length:372 start_codon:yes stop_codon:yes gene_type:complete